MNDEPYQGFAEMTTALDLLRKLEHDFERMQAEPWEPYPALDFFLTAEHIGDWPPESRYRHGTKGKQHGGNELLQTVCQLAVGVKHFEPTQLDHMPVADVRDKQGAFQRDAFGPGFDRGGLGAEMVDGERVRLTELAERVVSFWRAELSNQQVDGPG